MKKELRKHLQKYCDVSNWSRMGKPKAGKANYEAGKALAEDVLHTFDMFGNRISYSLDK